MERWVAETHTNSVTGYEFVKGGSHTVAHMLTRFGEFVKGSGYTHKKTLLQ